MITGYFGASNTGDEAILKVISKYFGHLDNVTIVGGGEYDSWMIDNAVGDLYASGIGLVRDMIGKKRQQELMRFKEIWVRTYQDYRLAKLWGLDIKQGCDSVVLMEPTEDGPFKDKVILIPTIHIKDKNEYPEYDVALPLNPYDDVEGSIQMFNDPQRYLNSLVGAKKVITWGRLHGHILSYIAGVEVVDMMPDNKVLAWTEMKERHNLTEMRQMAMHMINSLQETLCK